MADQGIAARRGAIDILDRVLGEGRLMSEALPALDRLDPADRARAQRLAGDVLRGLERLDRLLKPHLRKKTPTRVMNALRLGTLELVYGEAAHGVVNALVEIIGSHKRHGALKGLVNAVLRKVSEDATAKWHNLRVPRMPKWLRGPLVDAWGAAAVLGMEQAHFSGAPLDLSVKPTTSSVPDGVLLPTGSVRLHDAGQVTALAGYDGGDWWVQDAAAALPAMLLAPQKGERVLDMCAAPGGKTLQMAAAGAGVTALDISNARIARVGENLARCGLDAEVVCGDALQHTGQYDAVLLDAPCSATGTIRRHPDLPHAKDQGSGFGGLIELQAQMLAHAWTLVRPGGRLVYCTCSLLPDEGEVQIEDALDMFPDMQIDKAAVAAMAGVDAKWVTAEGGLRLRPDYWSEQGGLDGFYMALLHKADA
jgi:16S rRNA (cytosine967-C5)-methyltransferase